MAFSFDFVIELSAVNSGRSCGVVGLVQHWSFN
jgi:hypothetical protein